MSDPIEEPHLMEGCGPITFDPLPPEPPLPEGWTHFADLGVVSDGRTFIVVRSNGIVVNNELLTWSVIRWLAWKAGVTL